MGHLFVCTGVRDYAGYENTFLGQYLVLFLPSPHRIFLVFKMCQWYFLMIHQHPGLEVSFT